MWTKGSNPLITLLIARSRQKIIHTHEGRVRTVCSAPTLSGPCWKLTDFFRDGWRVSSEVDQVLHLQTSTGRVISLTMFPADCGSACFNPVRRGSDHPSSPEWFIFNLRNFSCGVSAVDTTFKYINTPQWPHVTPHGPAVDVSSCQY